MQKSDNKVPPALMAMTIFTMVLPLGAITTFLAKHGGIFLFDATTSTNALLEMSANDIYVSLIGHFYLVFTVLLLIPKSFIYKRTLLDKRKLRYDVLTYIILPLLITLFLTEVLMTIGLILVATTVWFEVLGPSLKRWLSP